MLLFFTLFSEMRNMVKKLNGKGRSAMVSSAAQLGVTLGVSHNGNVQVNKAEKQELFELIVASLFGKDRFYASSDQAVAKVRALTQKLVQKGELDFIANLAVYARREIGMRNMPVVLAVEFLNAVRVFKTEYAGSRHVVSGVAQRADQIMDLFAYAKDVFGDKKKIPLAIKKGLGDALNTFDAYQFAKYNRSNEVKLTDVLRIVHPTPKDEAQGLIFDQIMKGTLETPYTWETELSANGQLPKDKQRAKYDIWLDLVKSGKLGFQALVMNLRNMIEASNEVHAGSTNDLYTLVAEKLSDERAVQKSRMFPVQLYTAFEAIQSTCPAIIKNALSKALDASCANIGALGEDAWVIIDVSGSMQGKPLAIASIFAAAVYKANKGNRMKITMFSDRADHVNLSGQKDQSVLGLSQYIIDKSYGGGTNLAAALNLKGSIGFEPKAVMVFSDMQIDSLTGSYGYYGNRGRDTFPDVSKLFSKNAVKIAFNLNAYETTPLSERQGFFQMSGYSDKVFKFINLMNEGSSIVDALSGPFVKSE
jgi:hypothetical protein